MGDDDNLLCIKIMGYEYFHKKEMCLINGYVILVCLI
jgi:hypothetical protein